MNERPTLLEAENKRGLTNIKLIICSWPDRQSQKLQRPVLVTCTGRSAFPCFSSFHLSIMCFYSCQPFVCDTGSEYFVLHDHPTGKAKQKLVMIQGFNKL